MTTANKARIFTKAYHKYKEIESDKDLKKNHLTLAEYRSVEDILKEMADLQHDSKTFQTNVAEWFKRMDFVVELDADGVNWRIAL